MVSAGGARVRVKTVRVSRCTAPASAAARPRSSALAAAAQPQTARAAERSPARRAGGSAGHGKPRASRSLQMHACVHATACAGPHPQAAARPHRNPRPGPHRRARASYPSPAQLEGASPLSAPAAPPVPNPHGKRCRCCSSSRAAPCTCCAVFTVFMLLHVHAAPSPRCSMRMLHRPHRARRRSRATHEGVDDAREVATLAREKVNQLLRRALRARKPHRPAL